MILPFIEDKEAVTTEATAFFAALLNDVAPVPEITPARSEARAFLPGEKFELYWRWVVDNFGNLSTNVGAPDKIGVRVGTTDIVVTFVERSREVILETNTPG